jgi:hypothetical protein
MWKVSAHGGSPQTGSVAFFDTVGSVGAWVRS